MYRLFASCFKGGKVSPGSNEDLPSSSSSSVHSITSDTSPARPTSPTNNNVEIAKELASKEFNPFKPINPQKFPLNRIPSNMHPITQTLLRIHSGNSVLLAYVFDIIIATQKINTKYTLTDEYKKARYRRIDVQLINTQTDPFIAALFQKKELKKEIEDFLYFLHAIDYVVRGDQINILRRANKHIYVLCKLTKYINDIILAIEKKPTLLTPILESVTTPTPEEIHGFLESELADNFDPGTPRKLYLAHLKQTTSDSTVKNTIQNMQKQNM